MAERREPLIPVIGEVTDIRIDTPDVKTFRVVTPDGSKPFEHRPGQCAMLSIPGVGEAMFSITSSPTNTEYMEFSIIHTSLPTAVANAPPLPPSPIRMHNTGTFRADISSRFRAIASPCPLSSASTPQKAPGVFTKLIMGLLNFSACFIRRSALRYPSGMGIP